MTQKRLRQPKTGRFEIIHTLTQQEIEVGGLGKARGAGRGGLLFVNRMRREEDFDIILSLQKGGQGRQAGSGRASPAKRKRASSGDGQGAASTKAACRRPTDFGAKPEV
eukprot:evm.model.scf_27.12 EVM.evm.TU.scf_27.12   scf_27:91448-92021(+)